jgi:hypothetical protein
VQTAEPLEFLVKNLDLFDGVDILLSSPGRLDVADAVKKVCPRAVITCVEPNPAIRERLELQGYALLGEGNFLSVDCWPGFDRIVSIPETIHRQDVNHVRHAFRMLKPGGRLVAVLTEIVLRRTDALRKWLEAVGGEIEDLPDGLLFEDDSSATMSARLITVTKPEESASGAVIGMADVKVMPATAAGA